MPGGKLATASEIRAAVTTLKADLFARSEAGALFGQERGEALVSILGNLDQTVFGEPAYPSIESKAAHLLYFVIKESPLFRWQQAHRFVPVCRVSEPQRATFP